MFFCSHDSALSVEVEYDVQQYAFEILSNDTSLMYLETEHDSILQVFFETHQDGNIDLLLQVQNFLQEDDINSAETVNSNLSPEIDSEENNQAFNEIYIDTWEYSNFESNYWTHTSRYHDALTVLPI